MSVAFLGEVEGLINDGKLHALGISGPKRVKGIPTLESQGFAGVKEVVNMHSLLVPVTMSESQYIELRKLVLEAAKANSVQTAYQVDYCEPSELTTTQTINWFLQQIAMWKRLSQGVSIGNN